MKDNKLPANQEVLLSIVVPLFNEKSNLKALFLRLKELEERLKPTRVEIVLVDDCSYDNTATLARDLCHQYDNVRFIRLTKNSGSHAAIMAGLMAAKGECVTFIAADLQDPPELIGEMLDQWRQGISIVWAASRKNRNDGFFSSFYWLMVHHLSHLPLPKTGADFFLIDRKVIDTIAPRQHCNVPIFQLIAECGFKSAVVHFTKARRNEGKSGWTFKKKLTLILETLLVSPTVLRAFSVLGAALVAISILTVLIYFIAHIVLSTVINPLLLIITVLAFCTGLQMTMLGFVGEYLFVALRESRKAPRFVIAERVNFP